MNSLPTLTKEQYQSLMQLSDSKDDNIVKRYGYGDSLNIFLKECNVSAKAVVKKTTN